MVQSSDENEALWVALKRGAESDPWWNLLGVTVEQITRGSCRLQLHPSDAARRSPAATVREGVLACLMEAAVCTAIDSLDIPGMRGRTTVNLSMSILNPASQNVVAEARVIQAGAEGATGEAELRDISGGLVAKGIVVCAAPQD
jgi:acyl-coenzyme A thioesterase PaaI-like protein